MVKDINVRRELRIEVITHFPIISNIEYPLSTDTMPCNGDNEKHKTDSDSQT